ncbi:MAG: sulfite exporter TauE/SafE family protein [Hyphomonadaceae bacterium]
MIAGIPYTELAWLAAGLLAAGLATGVLAGLFGVGGGMFLVPLLYEVFRALGVDEAVRTHLAVGTSLAVIIPTSIRSYRAHLKKGAVEVSVLRLWAAPVVLGVILGAGVAAMVSGDVLKLVFSVVLGLSGVRMLAGRDDWRLGDSLPGKALMRAYGLAIGGLSTLMGIGGGNLSNLLLTLYGMPIHRVVATSSGLGVLISIPATIGYVIVGLPHQGALPPGSLGFVSLLGVILIAPASVLAAPWGANLAHRFSKRRLEVAFGLYQILVAVRFMLAAAG